MDLPFIFGERSNAVFDLWSLQHFCSGIFIGILLSKSPRTRSMSVRTLLLITLLLALCWESIELAMEIGYFGSDIAVWKGGIEHWGNRFLGDPLMVALGSLISRRFSHAWKIALVPMALWLFFNFTAPHSMFIQRFLIK